MKPKLCHYGNCEEDRSEVRVSYSGQRVSFCCVDHAALWLIRQRYPKAGIALDWDRHIRDTISGARVLKAHSIHRNTVTR